MSRAIQSVALLAAVGLAACSLDAVEPTTPATLGEAVPALHGHGQPTSPDANRDLAAARQATARFQQIERALAAGYDAQFPPGCFEIEEGGQGYHYLNEDYVGTLDVTRPQLLMYEPQKNGRLRLVGIEYIYPGDGTETPPELFGQQFHYSDEFQLWVLHVWNWRHNPEGMFADWNPKVSCEYAAD